jgi:hypothetical protein
VQETGRRSGAHGSIVGVWSVVVAASGGGSGGLSGVRSETAVSSPMLGDSLYFYASGLHFGGLGIS